MQRPDISELLHTHDAEAIQQGIATLLAAQHCGTENSVFQARAVGLIEAVTPALVWLRDHKGVPVTVEVLRSTLQLRALWMLAIRTVFRLPPDQPGETVEIRLDDMPLGIAQRIRGYLEELPGIDLTRPEPDHGFGQVDQQHGFALMYYTSIFNDHLSPGTGQP